MVHVDRKQYAVKFLTVREEFNEYLIENKILMRVKSVLTNVLASIEESKYGFDFTFRFINQLVPINHIEVSDLKFAASEEELRESVELRELPFTIMRDIINIYEIEKAIVMVALKVDRISLTDKKDPEGRPVVKFRSNTLLNVVQKP